MQKKMHKMGLINQADFGFGEVLIPSGTFVMGSPESEEDRVDNEVQHEVTLTKGFYMMKTQVTQKLWKEIMGENPSQFKGDDLPVENVSWSDCVIFANKLSEKIGYEEVYEDWKLNPIMNLEANGYRLPTEAEWEYAAKGGENYKYAGSNDLDEVGWYIKNSRYPLAIDNIWEWFFGKTRERKTHPVGQKKANGYGLHDMNGNVWEYCWDIDGAYDVSNCIDPQVNELDLSKRRQTRDSFIRIVRGGCWASRAKGCRNTYRGTVNVMRNWLDDGSLGVRLVRTQKNK